MKESTLLHISWINLYDLFTNAERKAAGINSQKKFASSILPSGLKSALFHGESPETMGTSLNRVFNHREGVSDRPFRHFLDKFLEAGASSGETFTSENHPMLVAVRTAWEQILYQVCDDFPDAPDRICGKIKELLDTQFARDDPYNVCLRLKNLLERCPPNERPAGHSATQSLRALSILLTSLTVIASTLPAWNPPIGAKNIDFFDLVLGALPESGGEPANDHLLAENNMAARELLIRAQALFDRKDRSPEDCQEIYALYIRILEMRPAVDISFCWDAQYLCSTLSDSGELELRQEHRIEDFLKRSTSYGSKLAALEQDPRLTFTFHRSKQPAISEYPGFCWANCRNEETAAAFSTLPSNWFERRESLRSFVGSHPDAEKRLLFWDESPEKNLSDLLEFLDVLHSSEMDPTRFFAIVRGPSDFLGPFLDTALSAFANRPPRISLLDEARSAAWELLGRHPLFYPVRHLKTGEDATLRFIILGSSPVAEWLVKEAFHLLDSENIRCRIDILAPDAGNLRKRLLARCPGMLWDNYPLPFIWAPEIHAHNIDLNTTELQHWLSSKSLSGQALYFAVAAETDRQNFELALFLRTWSVRRQVQSGSPLVLELFPPIAFHCRQPAIGLLASQLIVNKLSFGSRWYNNYALIPFGLISDIYQWDEAAGGLITKQASFLHLRYASNQPSMDNEREARSIKSRFERWLYPQESSAVGCLAIPYRLFAARSGRPDEADRRILPPHWNILNKDTFTDPGTRRILADLFDDFTRVNKEKALWELAEAEHARWCRYVLSRGWIPASREEMLRYMKDGYTSHKLFIAKMHPCICSYADMKELEELLRDEKGKTNDFRGNDLVIVRCTPDLLRCVD